MANNFVLIDSSKRLGSNSLNAVSQLSYALDTLRLMKNVMDNMFSGSDYTTLETQFGLPTGKGAVFYQYTSGALADLTDSTYIQPLIYALGTGR